MSAPGRGDYTINIAITVASVLIVTIIVMLLWIVKKNQ